ncbi:hypothetical protein ACFWAR_37995 [Streptomyces sp. NPDC059917]|uniref:hypothetical protein n=1 Tax=Streptomyces sp. NPDC059917 TaxID=3347002 RepID=UPI003658F075
MVPRRGVTIDITLREAPFLIIGAAGAALAVWTGAPPEATAPAALLVALRITVQRHQHA